MSFPSSLTEEELELKSMWETLKRVKKLVQSVKIVPANSAKNETESSKQPKKRNLEEIARGTEQAKRLAKAGGLNISKVEEKQTFKRSKQLDRKLKEGDRETTGVKYQPFNQSSYGDREYSDEPPRSAQRQHRGQSLYDNFVTTGETVGGAGGSSYPGNEARAQRGTTIYIRGYDLMEEPLRKAFTEFGSIFRVRVEERRRSAFIEYSTNEEADRAIKEMNGNMLNGITLRVTMARRQNYVYSRGGGGGGGSHGDHWATSSSAMSGERRGGGERERESEGGAIGGGGQEGRGVVTYDDADDY